MTITIDILMVVTVVAGILGLFLTYWFTKLGINALYAVREFFKDKTPLSEEANTLLKSLEKDNWVKRDTGNEIMCTTHDHQILIRADGVWIRNYSLNLPNQEWKLITFFSKKELKQICQKYNKIISKINNKEKEEKIIQTKVLLKTALRA